MKKQTTYRQEGRTANSRFAKAGVSYFYDSEVLNSSFVHLMKLVLKIPAFAKRQNVSNESTAYHTGQLIGLVFNLLAPLALSIWFWKKYRVRLSK